MSSFALLGSGGLDSTVAGALMIERGHSIGAVVFATYGQPSATYELRASKHWAQVWGTEWIEIDMNLHGMASMRSGVGVEGPRIVPARNLALIASASNVALSMGLDGVVIGVSAEDHQDYADCSPSFIIHCAGALSKMGLELEAPVSWLKRADIRGEADRLDIDLNRTWSCYTPRFGASCGECNSCRQDS